MPTVKMPRGDWDSVIMCLEIMRDQGWLIGPVISDITNQVDSQEH